MTEALATRTDPHPARVVVGDRVFVLEADRIHVFGSGPNADIRLVHDAIAPAHATICFHRGHFVVEAVGDAEVTDAEGARLNTEAAFEGITRLRLGPIEVELAPDVPSEPPTVPTVAAPRTATREASFSELMAHELRRAPWFALSILLHAIAFLLIWILVPPEPQRTSTAVQFAMADDGDDRSVDLDAPPEPTFDVEPPPVPQVESSPVVEPPPEAANAEDFDDPFAALPVFDGTREMFRRVTAGNGAGDILGQGNGEHFSTGFRKTVAGLRRSGLEIVFAFDSTGSMGPVLRATKERMARMVRALHALVPDARIGVVTYRDKGEREQYLTRSVPLDRDLYRSLAFLQTVDADGGGDRPEAVLEAMKVAVQQPWAPRSRRVVVLIGDAPAHPQTESQLERLVRAFATDGSACVHAIITASDLMGRPEKDVQRSFERIARAGKGSCVNSEREDSILKQVLSLAVGSEFRDNIEHLFDLVAEREGKVSTRALDLVRRLDADELRRELSRTVVDDDVVEALIRDGRRPTAEMLIRLLAGDALPAQGLHAAGFALQNLLGIQRPLIDPEHPERLSTEMAKQLAESAKQLHY